MQFLKLLRLVLFLALQAACTQTYSLSPVSATKDKWPRPEYAEQDLHSALASIEERLRVMETMRYSFNRWDMTIDRLSNKIEAFEARIARMHTSMQMKLESLFQAVTSTELKHDLLIDQLTRKLETAQERHIHKIATMKSDLEDGIKKVQDYQTDFLTKIDDKQNDIIDKTNNLRTDVDTLKLLSTGIEERINNTNKDIIAQLTSIDGKVAKNEHVEMLSNRLDGIHNHLNSSDVIWAQNDGPKELEQEKLISSVKSEVNSEVQKVGSKISNMYNELWKRTFSIETMIKDSIKESNATYKDIRDKIRHLLIEQRDCESFLDVAIDRELSIFHMQFNDLHRKIDNNFDTVLASNSNLMEKCHSSKGVHELEARVSTVLEKILDTFLNRTAKVDKQTSELLDMVKSHSTQSSRNSVRTENAVVTLADEMSQDHKNLHDTIVDAALRSDSLSANMQDLQDQLEELNVTIGTILPEIVPAVEKFATLLNNSTLRKEIFSGDNDAIDDTKQEQINAVEAHYSEGVIKIVTDVNDTRLTVENATTKSDIKTEQTLNSTNVNTKQLAGIITTKSAQRNSTYKNTTKERQTQKIESKTTPSVVEEISEETLTQIMLTYIKLIRRQISLNDFLQQAHQGKPYDSLNEMVSHLKPINSVPKDFIRELDQYQQLVLTGKTRHWDADPSHEDENLNYDDYDSTLV